MVDWADVAAVGIVATDYYSEANPNPVAYLIGEDRMGSTYLADAIASALREAFEAGLRESGNLYTEHSLALDRLLEQAEELAALRRELAARRAVDGWLGESNSRYLEVGILSGLLNAVERHRDVDGVVAAGATYPALVAALGLEVEDE
jgi:hypothetical protein